MKGRKGSSHKAKGGRDEFSCGSQKEEAHGDPSGKKVQFSTLILTGEEKFQEGLFSRDNHIAIYLYGYFCFIWINDFFLLVRT